MITLDQCKTDLADLNLQLHNIKAKLETSGGQIMNQFDLQMDCPVSREVETAQQKISGKLKKKNRHDFIFFYEQ